MVALSLLYLDTTTWQDVGDILIELDPKILATLVSFCSANFPGLFGALFSSMGESHRRAICSLVITGICDCVGSSKEKQKYMLSIIISGSVFKQTNSLYIYIYIHTYLYIYIYICAHI